MRLLDRFRTNKTDDDAAEEERREALWASIDTAREALEFKRVQDALGEHGVALVRLAQHLEPCEVIDGMVQPAANYRDRDVIPVIQLQSGQSAVSSMTYPGPSQRRDTTRELRRRHIRTGNSLYRLPRDQRVELKEEYDDRVVTERIGVSGLEISCRPHIVVLGGRSSKEAAADILHELSHVEDTLKAPVQDGAYVSRREWRIMTELKAYAIQSAIYGALRHESSSVQEEYCVERSMADAVEVARTLVNGSMLDNERAFEANRQIVEVFGELGLDRVFGSYSAP